MSKTIKIPVKKNDYIEWDSSISEGKHYAIDNLIKPIFRLFDLIESNCLKSCCGISAFNFTNASLLKLIQLDFFDPVKIHLALKTSILDLKTIDFEIAHSKYLNFKIPKETLIEILEAMFHFFNHRFETIAFIQKLIFDLNTNMLKKACKLLEINNISINQVFSNWETILIQYALDFDNFELINYPIHQQLLALKTEDPSLTQLERVNITLV